jgi:hypothetical protein
MILEPKHKNFAGSSEIKGTVKKRFNIRRHLSTPRAFECFYFKIILNWWHSPFKWQCIILILHTYLAFSCVIIRFCPFLSSAMHCNGFYAFSFLYPCIKMVYFFCLGILMLFYCSLYSLVLASYWCCDLFFPYLRIIIVFFFSFDVLSRIVLVFRPMLSLSDKIFLLLHMSLYILAW